MRAAACVLPSVLLVAALAAGSRGAGGGIAAMVAALAGRGSGPAGGCFAAALLFEI